MKLSDVEEGQWCVTSWGEHIVRASTGPYIGVDENGGFYDNDVDVELCDRPLFRTMLFGNLQVGHRFRFQDNNYIKANQFCITEDQMGMAYCEKDNVVMTFFRDVPVEVL